MVTATIDWFTFLKFKIFTWVSETAAIDWLKFFNFKIFTLGEWFEQSRGLLVEVQIIFIYSP